MLCSQHRNLRDITSQQNKAYRYIADSQGMMGPLNQPPCTELAATLMSDRLCALHQSSRLAFLVHALVHDQHRIWDAIGGRFKQSVYTSSWITLAAMSNILSSSREADNGSDVLTSPLASSEAICTPNCRATQALKIFSAARIHMQRSCSRAQQPQSRWNR